MPKVIRGWVIKPENLLAINGATWLFAGGTAALLFALGVPITGEMFARGLAAMGGVSAMVLAVCLVMLVRREGTK